MEKVYMPMGFKKVPGEKYGSMKGKIKKIIQLCDEKYETKKQLAEKTPVKKTPEKTPKTEVKPPQKVNFDAKNLKEDRITGDDKEYIYTDKFIKKIKIDVVEGEPILLNEFYKQDNVEAPPKYVGKMFKEMLKNLVKNKKVDKNDEIELFSPFYEDFMFDKKDPKKLLNYYKSLGFKLVGKYQMEESEDQFNMKTKIKNLI